MFIKLANDIVKYMFMTPEGVFEELGIGNTVIANLITSIINLIPGEPLTIIEMMLSMIGLYFIISIAKYFIGIVN